MKISFDISFGSRKKKPSAARAQKRDNKRRAVRRFLSAEADPYLKKRWTKADGSSINALIQDDLATMRNRCRFEVRNNEWVEGICLGSELDVVGTGPQLQIQTDDDRLNEHIEQRWRDWQGICDERGRDHFADLLALQGVRSLLDSGESFTVMTNRGDGGDPVQLRLLCVESDCVFSPFGAEYDSRVKEGIRLDGSGRPLSYYVAKQHPGDFDAFYDSGMQQIPAEQMLHVFWTKRANQVRGYPMLQVLLSSISEMNHYSAAVIQAADLAASLAGVLETDLPDVDEDATDDYEAFDEIEIEPGSFMTLPKFVKAQQFKPEQPTSNYSDYVAAKLKQCGRGVMMPYNVISGDSSGYNYASGRLDKQIWQRFARRWQMFLIRRFVGPVFQRWLREALLIPNYIPRRGSVDLIPHVWIWPGQEHVDPAKEANAQKIRLENRTTTLAEECAKEGRDWKDVLRQIAEEKKFMDELGLSAADVAQATSAADGADVEPDKPDEGDEDAADPANQKTDVAQ